MNGVNVGINNSSPAVRPTPTADRRASTLVQPPSFDAREEPVKAAELNRRDLMRLALGGASAAGVAASAIPGVARSASADTAASLLVDASAFTQRLDEAQKEALEARFPEALRIEGRAGARALSAHAVCPEAFGAVGDGLQDDQRAIQRAIDYAEFMGFQQVFFPSRSYSLWSPRRTTDPEVNNAYDGHSVIISKTLSLVGLHSESATLLFRSNAGDSLETDWQIVEGKLWRGSGIFLRGLDPDSDATPPSVELVNMTLDGGCRRGSNYGFPASPADGDGWDLTHKGLWSENDRRTGDWRLTDTTIRRFRGEMIYQGGPDHGAIIGRGIVMGETNADILNPCGTNIDIVGGYFYDGNAGWEGWGGRQGRLIRCTFENCRALGGMQGGKANTDRSRGYWTVPTMFEDGQKPWLTLDVRAIACGPIHVGSWVRGRLDMVDSFLVISTKVFPFIHDIELSVVARCENRRFDGAVSLTGGGPGSDLVQDVFLDVTLGEPGTTPNGPGFAKALVVYGDIGDSVVWRVTGDDGPSDSITAK